MSIGNKSRDELVEEAKKLGISFHHKLGAEKLAELIASHNAAQVVPEQAPGAIKDDNAGAPKKVAPKKSVKVQQKGKAKPPSRYAQFGGV